MTSKSNDGCGGPWGLSSNPGELSSVGGIGSKLRSSLITEDALRVTFADIFTAGGMGSTAGLERAEFRLSAAVVVMNGDGGNVAARGDTPVLIAPTRGEIVLKLGSGGVLPLPLLADGLLPPVAESGVAPSLSAKVLRGCPSSLSISTTNSSNEGMRWIAARQKCEIASR